MNMKERDRLRKLQDKWLDLHRVRAIIAAMGWDAHVTDNGTGPTFKDVKNMLYPNWEPFFTESLETP